MKTPKIFLSYSWAQTEIANEIDKAFQVLGITFTRDVRDAKNYKFNLKAYMESIRDCEFSIMLISDEFLKSENCMFEVLEAIKEKQYKEKILQVIIENANIFTSDYRIKIIKY